MRFPASLVVLLAVVAGQSHCTATDQVATNSVPSSAVLNEDTIWDPDAVFIGTQEMGKGLDHRLLNRRR